MDVIGPFISLTVIKNQIAAELNLLNLDKALENFCYVALFLYNFYLSNLDCVFIGHEGIIRKRVRDRRKIIIN